MQRQATDPSERVLVAELRWYPASRKWHTVNARATVFGSNREHFVYPRTHICLTREQRACLLALTRYDTSREVEQTGRATTRLCWGRFPFDPRVGWLDARGGNYRFTEVQRQDLYELFCESHVCSPQTHETQAALVEVGEPAAL